MRNDAEKYEELINLSREAATLESIAYLLEWDQETGMPKGGGEHRAGQLALIAGLAHQRLTSSEFGDRLAACELASAADAPLSSRAVNLRELRRRYDRRSRLPARLVEELARTSSLAHEHWVQARRKSEFGLFRPWLEKILALKREQAAAYGYDASPYDALLEDYEPGETEKHLEGVFSVLGKALPDLVGRICSAPSQPDCRFLHGNYPRESQRVFGEMAAAAIGFDFSAGRLDEVVHPFCTTIGPGDVRITTRFDSSDFGQALFGILHETGHALYEQGLPREHFGAPRGETVSLAIHESQSRMWENMVGRGRPFWRHFLPKARGVFHEALGGVGLEDFLRAVNAVRPSFIRVEADEVTYNLHIILRFELERELLRGELEAADVPERWNERFKQLLGLTVPDDSSGCLQDTHWASGLFGYFPTYCLGNLYAAQFFAAAEKALPGLEESFATGDFSPLLGWLRTNIHSQGMTYRAAGLVEVVTGKPLDPGYFLRYLRDKFGALYGLNLGA